MATKAVAVVVIMVVHSMMPMMDHWYYPNVNVYVNVNEYEHDYVYHS
jgi:hypothetical protein